MKKKIAILGSTGSIGKTLIEILQKDNKKFEIILLTANKNYKKLLHQAKILNVKNLIITNPISYNKILTLNKNKINIYNNFNSFNKIFKKKIDYCMCAITGIEGLSPTFKIIRYSKNVAIANKETIICAWDLINKELNKNKSFFIPVDSEHFSIWFGLSNLKNLVKQYYITASGGPFLDVSRSKLSNIKIKDALSHPNWKMGKKISIDSATMMNKVFEVIEAKNLFNLSYKDIKVLIHKDSYIHAILHFYNGMIKIIAHDTTMKIPIINSIYYDQKMDFFKKNLVNNKLNIKKLNALNFFKPNLSKFPSLKVLKLLQEKNSLYETVIVSINDALVEMYLNKKIKFNDISRLLLKFSKKPEFTLFKKKKIKSIEDIIKLNKFVHLKLHQEVYKN